MGLISSKNLEDDRKKQSVFYSNSESKSTGIYRDKTIETSTIKSVLRDLHLLEEMLSEARGKFQKSKLENCHETSIKNKKIAHGTQVKELDLRAFDAVEENIRLKLLFDLVGGELKIISGRSINSDTAVIAATGLGTGGVIITGRGIHALYKGYKLMKIDDRMCEVQKINRNVNTLDLEMAEKFVEMQVRLLRNKKKHIQVSLTSDAMLVVGGCLLVAAAVSTAGSYRIAAGVDELLSFEGNKLWKKYGFKKRQKCLKIEDARKAQEDESLKQNSPAPLSDHTVVQYMRVEPETFIKMMAGMLDVFPGEERVDQMLQLDTPKFRVMATLMLPRTL